jgi:FMN-dependent NADH-azoreductase
VRSAVCSACPCGTLPNPLLKTPRAFVVYARGGTYAEDSPTPASRFDHQKGYIDFWLKFIGVKKVQTLEVEGTTWLGKQKGEEAIARGQEEAKKRMCSVIEDRPW